MKCPACNTHDLSDGAWLPNENDVYLSDHHYDCANCGPIPKEYVDSVVKRIAGLEAQVASWEVGHQREVERRMALEAENAKLRLFLRPHYSDKMIDAALEVD